MMPSDVQSALREYAARLQRTTLTSRLRTEHDVKRCLVEPLLYALSWNPHDPEIVEAEVLNSVSRF